MLLVESVYAPYRETNSPPTFIPSLQHEAYHATGDFKGMGY